MWQLKANLFLYALTYHLVSSPITELLRKMAEPKSGQMEPVFGHVTLEYAGLLSVDTGGLIRFGEYRVILIVLGVLVSGYLHDKLGPRFTLNLSQLSSAMLYTLWLFIALSAGSAPSVGGAVFGGAGVPIHTIIGAGQQAKRFLLPLIGGIEEVGRAPLTAVVVQTLPILQHTLLVTTAAVAALRPFETSSDIIRLTCETLVWYFWGSTFASIVKLKSDLDASETLLVAAVVMWAVWTLNHVTFPRRRTAAETVAIRTGKSKSQIVAAGVDGRMDAALYSSASFISILPTHWATFLLVGLTQCCLVLLVEIQRVSAVFNPSKPSHAGVPEAPIVTHLNSLRPDAAKYLFAAAAAGFALQLVKPLRVLGNLVIVAAALLASLAFPKLFPLESAVAIVICGYVLPSIPLLGDATMLLRLTLFLAAAVATVCSGMSAELAQSALEPLNRWLVTLAYHMTVKLLYLVPTGFVVTAMVPGTTGQGLALFSALSTGISFGGPLLLPKLMVYLQHRVVVAQDQRLGMVTLVTICLTFLLAPLLLLLRPKQHT